MNPLNEFTSEFQSQGEQIKLVPRLVQMWDGVWVTFQKGPKLLVDYFILILEKEKEILLSTRCENDYKQHSIGNGSLLYIPFQCSAYSPDRIFLRPTSMRRQQEK